MSDVADWVELAVLNGSADFKRGDLKSAVGREDLINPDRLEEEGWHELEQRGTLFGNSWPLRLLDARLHRLSHSPVPLTLYRFWCLLSLGIAEQVDRTLFELTVAALLGGFGDRPGLHIGDPASDGMNPSFRERVAQYSSEAHLLPLEIQTSPLPHDKDLGLDAVTWLRFADERGADLHFLAQCSTGDDWESKLEDINLDIWADHIHWAVHPVRLFATPRVLILPEAKWVRVSRKGGVILDRPRLVRLAMRHHLDNQMISRLARRVNALSIA